MHKYIVPTELQKRLENDYQYHALSLEQAERCSLINDRFLELALLVAELTPQSREQSLAFTLLEQARMEATEAIARNEVPLVP